jgi:SAM-dependent methyltransferase
MPDQTRWDTEWSSREVIDDIEMRDFFGGRQYIAKFFPWWGSGLEAGCGLGRYVFYFSALDRKIVGVDFARTSIERAKQFAREQGFSPEMFSAQDLTHLDFDDGAFSYYISLGVLEHFYEGPERALQEAFRVLAPGGILLVTTPNKYSLEVLKGSVKASFKHRVGGANGSKTAMISQDSSGEFFQYWYSVQEIGAVIEGAGFRIMLKDFIDVRYPLFQKSTGSSLAGWLLRKLGLLQLLENSALRVLAGSSVVVAIKPSREVHCFFCGELGAFSSLVKESVQVPVCPGCESRFARIVETYRKRTLTKYAGRTEHRFPGGTCSFCGGEYSAHPIFGDFGFDRTACSTCLHRPEVRGELASKHVVLTWRPYSRENL